MTSLPATDAERLSQILLRVAACLALLLIAVVANFLLHGGSAALNPVAEAAERTQQTPGARLAVEAIYTSPALASPVVSTGSGVYNARTGRTRIGLDVPTALTPEKVISVGDEHSAYIRSPALSAYLPPGKPWLGIKPLLGLGRDVALGSNGGAKDELEMLRAVDDDVELVGEETVRGVATKRYRGSVDLGDLAAMLAEEGKAGPAQAYEQLAERMPDPIEVEAWIDPHGILRRERSVMGLPTTPGRPTITMDMRIELFDFGIAPRIDVPDRSEVLDSTPLARASLDLLNGESAQRLIHPAAGPPLAQSDFEQRGNEICRRLSGQVHALTAEAAPLMEAIRQSRKGTELKSALQQAGIGLYEPLVRRAEVALKELGQLKPEASTAAAYTLFLDHAALETELIEAVTSALEVGNLSLVRDLEKRLDQVSDESNSSADAVGLGDCSNDRPDGSSSDRA